MGEAQMGNQFSLYGFLCLWMYHDLLDALGI
jgi:hypothetical protein